MFKTGTLDSNQFTINLHIHQGIEISPNGQRIRPQYQLNYL